LVEAGWVSYRQHRPHGPVLTGVTPLVAGLRGPKPRGVIGWTCGLPREGFRENEGQYGQPRFFLCPGYTEKPTFLRDGIRQRGAKNGNGRGRSCATVHCREILQGDASSSREEGGATRGGWALRRRCIVDHRSTISVLRHGEVICSWRRRGGRTEALRPRGGGESGAKSRRIGGITPPKGPPRGRSAPGGGKAAAKRGPRGDHTAEGPSARSAPGVGKQARKATASGGITARGDAEFWPCCHKGRRKAGSRGVGARQCSTDHATLKLWMRMWPARRKIEFRKFVAGGDRFSRHWPTVFDYMGSGFSAIADGSDD